MENKIQNFKDLDAWKEGHKLVLFVYSVTKRFPKDEIFGIVNQMRRCAVSITSNIAEGFSRASYKEKAQFYSISLGSVTELQNQIEISKDIGYITTQEYGQAEYLTVKVHKILNGLIKGSRKFLILVLLLSPYSLFLIPDSASAATLGKPANNLGLVGYWSFDEGTSTRAMDYSGRGNTGTLSGTTLPSWTSGKLGKALSFDGSTSYVRIPSGFTNTIAGNDNHSVSLWFKANSFGQTVLESSDGVGGIYYIQFNGATGMYVQVGASYRTYTLSSSLVVGRWHYMSFVKNGSGDTGNLFIDGVLQTSYTGTIASTPSTPVDFLIGRYATTGYEFNGLIDDVRIYNRALSAAEVAALYGQGGAKLKQPDNKGLVGSWNFDEGAGNKALDASGRGNTGTLSGTTLPSWINGKHGKALSFDGSTSYVTTGTSGIPTGASPITVSFWMYQLSNTSQMAPVALEPSSGKSFTITPIVLSGTHYIWTDSVTQNFVITAGQQPPLNQWSHVVISYDGTNLRYYLNGAFQASLTYSVNTASLSSVEIGRRIAGAPGKFPGLIDDVKVYNRALSVDEIYSLYKSGETKINVDTTAGTSLATGLVGYWSFNGADVTDKVYDRSGQGNNGYFIGGATSSAKTVGKLGQALNFNGSSSYVSLPATGTYLVRGNLGFASADSFALSVWYKGTDIAQNSDVGKGLISWDNGGIWAGFVLRSGYAEYVHYDGAWEHNIKSTTLVADGKWHHVVYVNNNNLGYLYVDGVNQINGLSSTLSGGGTYFQPYQIGANYNNVYTSGTIDDVRIYNRALTAAEVKQLYNSGK